MSIGFNIVPQILMLRNMEPFGFKKYEYDFKEKLRNSVLEVSSIWALKKAYKIIAVSSFVKDFLVSEKNIDAKKLYKIYHGIERDFGDIEEQEMDEIIKGFNIRTPFILTSGSFRPYRRFEDVIAAFNKFKKELPFDSDIKLILAGRGLEKYMNKITRLIQNSPYQKDIIYLGFIKKAEMVSLYKRCDFYIASTEIEACPNIAIESLICGCPVISAKTVPLQEIYQDNAIFYVQRNVKELAVQMAKLFQDKKLKKELSIKAIKRSEYFSWEKCALETFNFLVKSVKK
jgi:glycosyltransferase involved in cell wall biosynthesis